MLKAAEEEHLRVEESIWVEEEEASLDVWMHASWDKIMEGNVQADLITITFSFLYKR